MAWLFGMVVPSAVLLAAVVGARRHAGRHERRLEADPGRSVEPWFLADPDTIEYYRDQFERVKSLLGLPPSFGFLVEANSPYPSGHAQAVAWLAIQIAKQAGLSQSEIEEIRLAGLVHDIGKTLVPLHLLNKPALLTPEEFETVKGHAAWGEKLLAPFAMKKVSRIVRHHHERYDGKGYPDSLAGDAIPLGARIVAVAESFQDMVSDQPYKSARTFGNALEELQSCSGTQFDPKVITIFLEWLQATRDPRERNERERGASADASCQR